MKDQSKTKQVLIQELASLRQRNTELERSELERKNGEDVRFRELFNHMSSGVAVYEAVDNGGDFIFRDFNPAAEKIEKVSRKDILGKRVSEVFPGVKAFGVFEVFQRVWQTGKPEYYPENIYKDERDPGSWRENWVLKLPTGEIVTVYNDITERKRAEEDLQTNQNMLKQILDTIPQSIFWKNETGVYMGCNQVFAKDARFDDPEQIVGKTDFDIWPQADAEAYRVDDKEVLISGKRKSHIIESLEKEDGSRLWVDTTKIPLLDANHEIHGIVGVYEDITERKLTEEKIKASLLEKEILLREVHHRVKNNMQVISGLLDLQAKSTGNPELTERLNESQKRIHAMAMVHEKLYGAKDFTRIDLAGYVRTLSQELFQTYKINPGKIDLIVQTDGEVYLDVNKAIPCGLILNELISNALKHAFPGGRQGEIQIIIGETKNTEVEIVVRDNGLGLPEDIDIHQPRTVGFHLVNGLVEKQLDGQLEVSRGNGTEFRIKFPL